MRREPLFERLGHNPPLCGQPDADRRLRRLPLVNHPTDPGPVEEVYEPIGGEGKAGICKKCEIISLTAEPPQNFAKSTKAL